MSEEQKAVCRASGAFDNFLADMKMRLEREGRTPEYITTFWDNLRDVASDFAEFGN